MADIAKLAQQVALEIEQANPLLTSFSEFDRGRAITYYMHGLNDTVSQLNRAIAEDERLGHLRSGWFDSVSGGSIIQDHMLPHILVSGVLHGQDAGAMLAAAQRFAASGTSTIDTYVLLAGVSIAAVVKLQEGLDLLPWSQVPDGRGRDWFRDASDPTRLPLDRFGQFAVSPTIAIRHRERNRKVLFASHDEVYPDAKVRLTEAVARHELTADVIRCLTASSIWPVGLLGSWSELDDEFGNQVGASAFQYYSGLTNILFRSSAPDSIDRTKSLDCSRSIYC